MCFSGTEATTPQGTEHRRFARYLTTQPPEGRRQPPGVDRARSPGRIGVEPTEGRKVRPAEIFPAQVCLFERGSRTRGVRRVPGGGLAMTTGGNRVGD